jgi:hypothetical protein
MKLSEEAQETRKNPLQKDHLPRDTQKVNVNSSGTYPTLEFMRKGYFLGISSRNQAFL